jgi:hypothetical protein
MEEAESIPSNLGLNALTSGKLAAAANSRYRGGHTISALPIAALPTDLKVDPTGLS